MWANDVWQQKSEISLEKWLIKNVYLLLSFVLVKHLIERHVIRCGSKNEQEKTHVLKEMGLHVQDMITILDSIVHIIGGEEGRPIWNIHKHQ